jgi:hypothetical protein
MVTICVGNVKNLQIFFGVVFVCLLGCGGSQKKVESETVLENRDRKELIERYLKDLNEAVYQDCLDRVPPDCVLGETYPISQKMRMGKSFYDWSEIVVETDVSTPQDWLEAVLYGSVYDCPAPALRLIGDQNRGVFLLSSRKEEDKYKLGNDGRIEWIIVPGLEDGRKSLTLRLRGLRN